MGSKQPKNHAQGITPSTQSRESRKENKPQYDSKHRRNDSAISLDSNQITVPQPALLQSQRLDIKNLDTPIRRNSYPQTCNPIPTTYVSRLQSQVQALDQHGGVDEGVVTSVHRQSADWPDLSRGLVQYAGRKIENSEEEHKKSSLWKN